MIDTWSEDAAFEFIRRAPIAKDAAQEGWIGPLVGFIRQNKRAPGYAEIPKLKKIQREFEDALITTAASKGFTAYWKPLGEAMAKRRADWAGAVIA